eukprot:TCALIF_00382-PA protein Name:"Similar to Snx14 Sorting nexin-14 (Mus musculus)" AED:0.14 eAED:0.14 QI:227/0.95/0.85/1/0.7/0.66/21/178/1109
MILRVAGTPLSPKLTQKLVLIILAVFISATALSSLSTGLLLLTSFCFGAAAFSLILDLCPNNELPNFLASVELPLIHPGLPKDFSFTDPWRDIQVPIEVDDALNDLYEHILRDYVYSWYGMISYDEEFVQEIRHILRYASSVIVRRLSRVNLATLITRKAIPIGLSHLDACYYARQYARENEVLYIQSVARRLLKHVFPKRNLNSGSVKVLLADILSGSILQPLMDILADPDIINYILETSFSLKSGRVFDPPSGVQVEFLKRFVTTSEPQNLSSLFTDLSGILKDQQTLFAFIKFLREEGGINQLQFFRSIEDFNKKIMNPDLTHQEILDLHNEAVDIFNLYLKSDAIHHVDIPLELVKEIELILVGNKEDVLKLRTTTPLFQAYEAVYTNLVGLCPAFHKSVQFYSLLLGTKGNDAHDEAGKPPGRSNFRGLLKRLPLIVKPSSFKPKPTNNPRVPSVLFEKSDLHMSVSTPNFAQSSNKTPSLNIPIALNTPKLDERRPSDIDLARLTALTSLKTNEGCSLVAPTPNLASSKSMTNLRMDDHQCFEHHPVEVHYLKVKQPPRKTSRSRSSSSLEDGLDLQDMKDLTTIRRSSNSCCDHEVAKVSPFNVPGKSQTLPLNMPSQSRRERNFPLKEIGTKLKKSISLFPFTHSKAKDVKGSQQCQDDRRPRLGTSRTTDKIGNSLTKLRHGVMAKSMEGLVDEKLDPALDIADICENGEKEESLSNCSGSIGEILEFRDLTAWRVSIPRLSTAKDVGGKPFFVYVIEVQRIDVTSQKTNAEDLQWSVARRYLEFYALESKLTEFHGEFENAKLPSRSKLFSGKGLDELESKMKPFESYLQCLLQNPSLKRSEILFTFLTSTEEFTVAASQLGKMIKNVPIPKLTKEKPELKPFIAAYFASTQAEPAKPSYDSVIGGDFSDAGGEKPIKPHPLFHNNQDAKPDKQVGHCHKYYGYLIPKQEEGVYDTLMYLALKVFKIQTWKGQFLQGLRILCRNTADHFVEFAIAKELVEVLNVGRIVHLCNLLEGAIFEPQEPRTDEMKLERKARALENFLEFLRPLIGKLIGQRPFDHGISFVFESLQDPVINKQLAYTLFDTALVELFPEMEVKIH